MTPVSGIVPISRTQLPAIIAGTGERARVRFLEFFTAQIRNPHTRRAYARAAAEFLAWCEGTGVYFPAAGAADACGRLDRTRGARSIGAQREAAPGRHPSPVRLAGDRPHRPSQSRGLGARPAPRGALGKDSGARSGRGAAPARFDRLVYAGGAARQAPSSR